MSKATIAKLVGREVYDARGRPTVEVEALTTGGAVGRAIAPSCAHPGRHDAAELRDADPGRHRGQGVRKAIAQVEGPMSAALAGLDAADQGAVDAALLRLDGTPDKSRLGANSMIGASKAAAHAAAAAQNEELYVHLNRLWRDRLGPGEPAEPALPLPMVTMIAGGLLAGAHLEGQGFAAVPLAASSFPDALEMAAGVHRALGEVLRGRGEDWALVGDLGGYAPKLRTNFQALDRMMAAIRHAGWTPGRDVGLALDVAASHFHNRETLTYVCCEGEHDTQGMVALLVHWFRQYPIVSFEDGLAEDDWDGWAALTERLGGQVQLAGFDLFAAQADRLRRGAAAGAGNAAILHPCQAGTLTETLDALLVARRGGYRTILAARSGETEDTTLADLAVATSVGQVRFGALSRSEHLAKYNRLLRIASHLGPAARYAGRKAIGA